MIGLSSELHGRCLLVFVGALNRINEVFAAEVSDSLWLEEATAVLYYRTHKEMPSMACAPTRPAVTKCGLHQRTAH
jgi:hypothetical protein